MISSEKPQSPFNPSQTFYITPHCSFTKNIQILDLTPHLTVPYTDPTFPSHAKQVAKQIAKQAQFPPSITIQKDNISGTRYLILDPNKNANDNEIATWKASHFSTGPSHLTFPAQSPHSSHTITLRPPRRFLSRNESFVHNSATYTWAYESWIHPSRVALWRELPGGGKKLLARYWQGIDWRTGGTIVVEGEEVDAVIAVVTCVVLLKKKRQRRLERSG
ncbi:hypothetical protein FGG08_003929 [Glutinoglossum americanum]|uniref:Uncharacterized protein n=1 Tax=Glutinoglossum americanum TaxID=1670608 RepID=A0A9P8L4C1_9PEZI|nr:hypothetical protein FGG08_003929 [Glutinoglossum americanum]